MCLERSEGVDAFGSRPSDVLDPAQVDLGFRAEVTDAAPHRVVGVSVLESVAPHRMAAAVGRIRVR